MRHFEVVIAKTNRLIQPKWHGVIEIKKVSAYWAGGPGFAMANAVNSGI
jgi:hypothetical protein